MTTASVEAKVVQKIIERIKTLSDVTKWIGTGSAARVYGSQISTLQDVVFPCVSITTLDGSRARDASGIETITIQIDLWFNAEGKNATVWDDVMESFAAIENELHNNGHWDSSIGLNLFEMTLIGRGPQMYEADTKLNHYNGRFRVRATV